jgi:hypothetical protein
VIKTREKSCYVASELIVLSLLVGICYNFYFYYSGYIQTHCQKNKKIKRADQILPEVHGTTHFTALFIHFTTLFIHFTAQFIHFTALFIHCTALFNHFTALLINNSTMNKQSSKMNKQQ